MAENNIDDMLKNQTSNKKKKKGLKVVIFLIILLLIVVIAVVVVFFYLKKQNKVTPKQEFIQSLKNDNVVTSLKFDKFENFISKFMSESSETTTEISGDIPSKVLNNEIDLSELNLNINSKNSPTEKKHLSNISFLYQDNEMFNFDLLIDNDKIGIFSKDVIIKYIGSKLENLFNTINRINNLKNDSSETSEDNDVVSENLKSLISKINIGDEFKNINFEIPKISKKVLDKYIEIFNTKAPESAFSSKAITLDRESKKIDVTEHSMKLSESETIEIASLILQTLESDDELYDAIFTSLNVNNQEVKDTINNEIEQIISSLYEKKPDENSEYTFNIYETNGKIYKISIDLNSTYTLDFDFDYSDNVNSVTITVLKVEDNSGFTVEIENTISDVTEKFNITLNLITNSEIVSKINFVSDLVDSGKSYTIKNTLDVNLESFKCNFQTNSQISFKEVKIDSLSDDNCLFLDELDDEELLNNVSAIENKTIEVLNQNLVGQGLDPVLGEENSEENSVENKVDNSDDKASTNIDPEVLKEEAKNKVINSVSEAMNKAQEEGREYQLSDIMNLEIPDSIFSVSIDGDVATISIDGFEFKINSKFEIYE